MLVFFDLRLAELLASCLVFRKISGWEPQKKVANKKKVQIYIKLYKKCVVVYKYAFVVVGVG